jgi:DNA repair exonuclease SbcCD ATPase subunit
MILEGFEIENWSCIRRLAIGNLPSTGIVVFHGPNGTGKSSIIAALRACLMDYASNSNAQGLHRNFPRNTNAKPRVSATFRAQGASWRITKVYGTRDSRLEKRNASGKWEQVVASAADAHSQTLELVGSSSSEEGLHQLLWLTQAEYRLPDPKKFDADVQSRLRGVLGVLQTPLDDRFIERVRKEWSRWFTSYNTPGQATKLKPQCSLSKSLAALEVCRDRSADIEAKFQNVEAMTERSLALEEGAQRIRTQLQEQSAARDRLQSEYEKSLTRLETHQRALERRAGAEESLEEAKTLKRQRVDAEARVIQSEQQARLAHEKASADEERLNAADTKLRENRRESRRLREAGAECQAKRDAAAQRLHEIELSRQANTARERLRRAEELQAQLDESANRAKERPAPTQTQIKQIEDNRSEAARLRAELQAAGILLIVRPDAGAAAPNVTLDGIARPPRFLLADGTAIQAEIKQNAEIAIPGWGLVQVARVSDGRSLAQLLADTNRLDKQFAELVAPFGLAGDESLHELRARAAAFDARQAEQRRLQAELHSQAPHGIDALRRELSRGAEMTMTVSAEELVQQSAMLKVELDANAASIRAIEQAIESLDNEIDREPEGLRRQAGRSRLQAASAETALQVHRADLKRLPTGEQIEAVVKSAESALAQATRDLEEARLSADEQTIRTRLDQARAEVDSTISRLKEVERDYNQVKGALSQTAGLHQDRAAAAAQVEWLTTAIKRERLESQAIDRLYAVFEECRQKQLGAVMGPIHDRVLKWMDQLKIPGYEAILFNDQFLPDRLMPRNGAADFAFDEESVGTIEQMALMVRLALGSALSTAKEPVTAVLDDPLSHSDFDRLKRMHAVLQSAASGDSSSRPPAGPLQILLFTCHPDWFPIEGARAIDLGNPDILRKG